MGLQDYTVRTDGGFETTLRLTAAGAEKRGLTDADLTATRNAARTATESGAGDPGAGLPALSAETTDLSKYRVGDVTAYLAGATEDERARVIALEAGATKPRTTITDWTPPAT